jgi:hypothetical protein
VIVKGEIIIVMGGEKEGNFMQIKLKFGFVHVTA